MTTQCLQSSPAECVTRECEYSSIPPRAVGQPRRKTPRLDLIARVRAEIAAGTCDTDEKLTAAIDDLLLSP